MWWAEEETVEAHEVEKKEELSSTPRKDDHEGDDAVDENQAGDASKEQIED